MSDSVERSTYGTDPTEADSDGDGLSDETETTGETDPLTADTDGDGVLDGTDGCATTQGATANGCPISGEGAVTTTLPNAQDLSIELSYSANSHGYYSDVTLSVVGEGESATFEIADTDGRTVSERFDVTQFAGQTITVRFETRGSKASFDELAVQADSDGDGIRDSVENQRWYHPRTGNAFSTDPYSADTDGDGLTDSQEVGYQLSNGGWEITSGTSNPITSDSDGDLVSDRLEVRVSGSNPFAKDTDDDGFGDLRDPTPTEETSPIAFEADSDEWGQYVRISAVHGGEISAIDVRAHYSPPVADAYWAEGRGTLIDVETQVFSKNTKGTPEYGWAIRAYTVRQSDEKLVIINGHGLIDQNPDKYYLNVTDDEGNEYSYLVEPDESAGSRVSTAGIYLAGGTTANPLPGDEVPGIIAGGGIIALGGAVKLTETLISDQPAITSATFAKAGALTLTAKTYDQAAVHPAVREEVELPIRLPAGAIYEGTLDDGSQRGYGWEYIKETPGIGGIENLGEILRQPDAVTEVGGYTLVIGENPNGPGKIQLWLVGSSVFSASHLYEDPLGEQVVLPDRVIEKIKHRHPEIGQSTDEVIATIHELIEDANEVYVDDLGYRMYITEVNGKIMFLLVSPAGKIITAYSPAPSSGYSHQYAIEYVLEQIEKYGFTKIYEDDPLIPTDIGGGA